MQTKIDQFGIDLNLHHPSCDPQAITTALSLEPWFSAKHGQQIGSVTHKTAAWLCHFRKGTLDSEFERALDDVVSLVSEQEAFISEFVEQGGELEIVLNSTVETKGSKLFELRLHSWFLKQIAERGINLRVQVWSAESA
jgi:Domain of unknown function (DUF4279)